MKEILGAVREQLVGALKHFTAMKEETSRKEGGSEFPNLHDAIASPLYHWGKITLARYVLRLFMVEEAVP